MVCNLSHDFLLYDILIRKIRIRLRKLIDNGTTKFHRAQVIRKIHLLCSPNAIVENMIERKILQVKNVIFSEVTYCNLSLLI